MAGDLTHTYDAFLSHDPADAAWVETWLLPRFQSAGLAIATAMDFDVGVPRLVNIERLTDASRHTLLVLSPAWLNSDWRQFEALLAQTADPAGILARTIPLLQQPCTLPRRIAMLEYADFTGSADRWESQLQRVIKAMGTAARPTLVVAPAISPAAVPAARQADIDRQQERLDIERDRLADLLLQEAKLGSAWAPPGVTGGIREARTAIKRIKITLSGWGVIVADHPDDV
ncbi:MAG: toll/interleukin-1 receptor domain-containing protein [Roseiflexaceae bacterium]